jgi:UDP-N-acetylglucosamine 2-epimerase (non-hydrolysing)
VTFLSIIGTRPQIVKLAPIYEAFVEAGAPHSYIDTGQHYDAALSKNLQSELGIPNPLKNLNIGSHSHAVQTAKTMEALDFEIDQIKPTTVLVYGDTNSTIAATLVAVKKGIQVAHVEAGLRSFNRAMPEELNRVATDHLSDILFCPTANAMQNLKYEGLDKRSLNVGDVMCDLLVRDAAKFVKKDASSEGLQKDFLVATIHRAENTDSKLRLQSIIDGFATLSMQIVLFAHPRLKVKLREFDLEFSSNVKVLEPVNHSELLSWAISAAGVITDSGGFQKEAFILGVPCTTIRTETEWIETLENDWNVLVPNPADLKEKLNTNRNRPRSMPFGDGTAAKKIVSHLIS